MQIDIKKMVISTEKYTIITTGRAGGLHQPPWGMSIG
jgi:hypothetical protein